MIKTPPKLLLPAGQLEATVQQVEGAAPYDPERDEISRLLNRIKQADQRNRTSPAPRSPAPSVSAIAWAEEWNLPQDVHQYFTLEQA